MGDRRNVIVQHTPNTAVALYTHWAGTELPATLAKALDRGRDRWSRFADTAYVTRVIFSEMIAAEAGDDVVGMLMSSTGLGIEPVDLANAPGTYCEAQPGYDPFVNVEDRTVEQDGVTYSFDQYIEKFLQTV